MNEREAINTNRLERATEKDVDKVFEVIKADGDWLLKEKGLDHWSSYYTREIMENKVKKQEVYLTYKNNEVVGTISFGEYPPDYYVLKNREAFTDPKAKALYLSSLAIKPEFHGQGIASDLMNFADSTAKSRGAEYVRFDCREEYGDLVNFYIKRGYKKVGSFVEEEGYNYLLMEKKV
ncbi:MAG: GNAT family N-acetyltransferase [Candidatus Shapirobacteria bacterium]|nr:GNAT family N-acetyltransferase [Candidatus Shapirobacteria bacterium]MDD3002667.1 GNAT family N-acetyltransferase [Candidatus Shapirobacteria bacterium]MDD4382848.1 GNAT family N-acetyltransferase [Candidatus Shapirobacteria bacterium]